MMRNNNRGNRKKIRVKNQWKLIQEEKENMDNKNKNKNKRSSMRCRLFKLNIIRLNNIHFVQNLKEL
jgi:hypothetical protein